MLFMASSQSVNMTIDTHPLQCRYQVTDYRNHSLILESDYIPCQLLSFDILLPSEETINYQRSIFFKEHEFLSHYDQSITLLIDIDSDQCDQLKLNGYASSQLAIYSAMEASYPITMASTRTITGQCKYQSSIQFIPQRMGSIIGTCAGKIELYPLTQTDGDQFIDDYEKQPTSGGSRKSSFFYD